MDGMTKCFHVLLPVIGSHRKVTPNSKMRRSAKKKLGNAWPTTARVRAKRSIMVFGRIAASTPSGMDSTSAKVSALAPSIMVTGARSKTTEATSVLRYSERPKSPWTALPAQSRYWM